MTSDDLYGDRPFSGLERRDPSPGCLLVAAPDMGAPEFARSVVFVIDHDATGTLGVDLSRRSDMPVINVLEDWAHLMAKPLVVHLGGPVNPTQPICLAVVAPGHELSEEPREDLDGAPAAQRLDGRFAIVNLGAEPEEFEGTIDGARLFAGYAGWGPGQLHDELERGDWLVAPALPSDLLAPTGVDVWGDVMRRQTWPLPLYATHPGDVREN